MRFFDFCSGIGGGRLALEAAGHECVGFSENDKTASLIYSYFTGDYRNAGDVMLINPSSLPDFDIMLAGFPYKNFAAAGTRMGFSDNKAHVLTALIGILSVKKPPYFIFENDKGFLTYNGGRAYKTVCEALESAGYKLWSKVLNSSDFGIPHLRERLYIVGALPEALEKDFEWCEKTDCMPIENFLCDADAPLLPFDDETFLSGLRNDFNRGRIHINELLTTDYTVIDRRWQDYRVYSGRVPTLSSSRAGIVYVKGNHLYRLTGYEALLLQGFPEGLAAKAKEAGILKSSLMKYAANSVSVNVIKAVADALGKCVGGYDKTYIFLDTACVGASSLPIRTYKHFADKINAFNDDSDACQWLLSMGKTPENLDFARAEQENAATIIVLTKEKNRRVIEIERIFLLPLSPKKNSAVIAKMSLSDILSRWQPDSEISDLLAQYIDSGVKFKDFTDFERETLRRWFYENRFRIVSEVLCERGDYALITRRTDGTTKWRFTGVGALVAKHTAGDVSVMSNSIRLCGLTLSRVGKSNIKFTVTE